MSAPPAVALSSSSDDDSSSSHEAQYIVQCNLLHTERDDNKLDSDFELETDTDPLAKTQKSPQKLSKLEDSSEEDEEEEQEEVENPKLSVKTLKTPQELLESDQDSFEQDEEEEQEQREKLKLLANEPESQPNKKKLKFSVPADQATSQKSSSIHRIWSLDDEMVLLRALSEFQIINGKLPPRKDYASFLSGISGSISFPATETQIFYKIRQLRHNYSQKKKKGFDINFSQPHEKIMFDLSAKLFEGSSKVSKKRASPETNHDTESESGGKQKKRITQPESLMEANGGAVLNGGVVARSYYYLAGLIKDMTSTQQCLEWLSTVEDMVALIGESKVKDLEAKTRMLRINEIKLHAMKEKLMAEMFDILADEMVQN